MPYRPKIRNDDGTLTDLPIEAETTVKLKSSRNIGLSGVVSTPQSFNGTSAITIPITASKNKKKSSAWTKKVLKGHIGQSGVTKATFAMLQPY